MEDILEESEFLQKWVQKGKAQGLEEGLEEGKLRELRNMLVHFTTLRFPDLVSQAQKQAEQVKSQEQLRTMIDQLIAASTAQNARAAITS